MSERIGYLRSVSWATMGHTVACDDCIAPVVESGEAVTPMYRDNIFPYRQNCGYCGRELVRSDEGDWPELFV